MMTARQTADLIAAHAAALALFARQWCDTPEDAVQDAFCKLVRLHTPPGDPADRFWELSDRGPNIACSDAEDILGVDPKVFCSGIKQGRIYPLPATHPRSSCCISTVRRGRSASSTRSR